VVPLLLGVQARDPQHPDRHAAVRPSFFSFESTLCHTAKLLFQQTGCQSVTARVLPKGNKAENTTCFSMPSAYECSVINIQMHIDYITTELILS